MGYQTLQLFSISSHCSGQPVEYIFKEISSGTSEIISLQKYFLAPSLIPFLYPRRIENFPSFILPSAYISYVYNNKAHYTSLMLKAPGELLASLPNKYKNNLEKYKNVIQKIYYEIGLAMSNFHKKFMDEFKNLAKQGTLLNPTYVHADAHQANIVYDIKTNQVTFIDNERIASYSPKSPFYDIEFFIFLREPRGDYKFLNTWLFLSISSFLLGYIHAYPLQDRKKVFNELIAMFNNPTSYELPGFKLYDKYISNKKIFDYIFDWINKQLNNETPIDNLENLNDKLVSLNNALSALRNRLEG